MFFTLHKKVKGFYLWELVAYSEKKENKQWTKLIIIQLVFYTFKVCIFGLEGIQKPT